MATETITNIALTALRESPFNPRKTYSDAALQELADSIATQGVMSPIVVRPFTLLDRAKTEYEIVFGHRRARAAERAGLETIPAIVRAMSDEEAAVAQVHENLQREDVSPMEEADSFEHLRVTHGLTGDQIATSVGKTKAYVYGRLKLAKASPEVRTAIASHGLSPEIGLRISRFPHHDMQRQALKVMVEPGADKPAKGEAPTWRATRDANRALKWMFTTNLDHAKFDQADFGLVPSAGACTDCPKRAGNIDGLQDLLEASICTDKACHDSKSAAHHEQRLATMRAAGHRVLVGDEAKALMPSTWSTPDGLVRLDDIAVDMIDGKPALTWREAIEQLEQAGKKVPPLTVVDHGFGREPIELLTDDQAAKVGKALHLSNLELSTPGSAALAASGGADEAFLASLTREQRACFDRTAWASVKQATTWAIAATPRTALDLRRIAQWALYIADEFDDEVLDALGLLAKRDAAAAEEGDYAGDTAWMNMWIAEAPIDEVASLLTALAVDQELGQTLTRWQFQPGDQAAAAATLRCAIAGDYGVDAASFVDAPVDEPTVEEVTDEGASGAARARKPRSRGRAAEAKVDNQKDDAGDAGDHEAATERCPNTIDMLEQEAAS